jgi:hypothetical protein
VDALFASKVCGLDEDDDDSDDEDYEEMIMMTPHGRSFE